MGGSSGIGRIVAVPLGLLAAGTAVGDGQQSSEEGDREEDEQGLVPSSLVGEDHRPSVADMERHRTRQRDGNTDRALVVEVGEVGPQQPSCATMGRPDEERQRVLEEAKVRTTIEAIRPAIQADGGDIFLRGVDTETGVVQVELVGACVSCPASTVTLKAGIERILKDRVEGVTEVVNVGEVALDGTPVSL
jgi:Fe-S cluster biogenesis protein NfuA